MTHRTLALILAASSVLLAQTPPQRRMPRAPQNKQPRNLPSSKMLLMPVPGGPQAVGTSPATAALSPDGRYLALLQDGYGSADSGMRQGIAILDLASNQLAQFPDSRFVRKSKQSFFLGLAFSSDGKHLYASVGATDDPLGKKPGSTGNGIAVYSFNDGAVAPERFISIPLQPLAAGKRASRLSKDLPSGQLIPYPAGLAVIRSSSGDRLLVADNLSDDVLLLDAASGRTIHRFDLSTGAWVPSAFPYTVVASRDGRRAWCSLWNGSQVAELDLVAGTVAHRYNLLPPTSSTAPGSHPTALLLTPDQQTLYVALSNADRVAAISLARRAVTRYLSVLLPGQVRGGAYPNALALSSDGKRLFVANASSDSVAVFDTVGRAVRRRRTSIPVPQSPLGFIPTEWYPTALAVHGDDLFVVTAKGRGTGPNSINVAEIQRPSMGHHPYIPTLISGSLARVGIAQALQMLPDLTSEVLESNLMSGRRGQLAFRSGQNPIRHVIYVIKENRTYDQLFGDLGVGDGDPSLVLYGEDVTPNQHRLARQFGVLDNFYDSAEVSAGGHVWSTAAITSDYTEKTWQIFYRTSGRTYDYEGEVANEVPLDQDQPDINEPGTGYLWTNMARHNISQRDYGEYIADAWCDAKPDAIAWTRPAPGDSCPAKTVAQGETLPANVGDPRGAASPWPWPVPIPAHATATKPELRSNFDPRYPGFRLDYPDQLRMDEFLNEFDGFVRARREGQGTQLPQFVLIRLGNDHTSGTKAGLATPAAANADNDLAVGRLVDAVSHSAYWDDTAICILEDDAQDGVDHVDAHRSIALVISEYSPGSADKPYVDHNFYTTVSMIHTMEVLLGAPAMNNNDAQAPVIAPLFSGDGNQPPFTADYRNRDNGLIYKMNPPEAPGARESAAMDFDHADAIDVNALNRILWRDAHGDTPMPAPRHTVFPARPRGHEK